MINKLEEEDRFTTEEARTIMQYVNAHCYLYPYFVVMLEFCIHKSVTSRYGSNILDYAKKWENELIESNPDTARLYFKTLDPAYGVDFLDKLVKSDNDGKWIIKDENL